MDAGLLLLRLATGLLPAGNGVQKVCFRLGGLALTGPGRRPTGLAPHRVSAEGKA
ncbi:hypothetical protein ACH492_00165 [Streptomyces sp. NPDC019443]|uniref:hypothetical protein n=1 Tax=Streptomyces sp. NPDC019443 TaxID=3365061 RepID=UPI00378D563F